MKLRKKLEKRATVPLKELYGTHARGSSDVSAARAVAYSWLAEQGMGVNEIGRLFDRSPGGVSKLMRRG